MFKSKPINLSESVVVALEAVKQALEVFHGFEVSFAGGLKINPQLIKKFKNTEYSFRCIKIIGQYRQRCGSNSVFFSATIELKNYGYWLPDRIITLCIGEPEGIHSWCVAHWGVDDDDANTVRVIVVSGEGSSDLNWQVGHGLYDRRLEPLYPRAVNK